VVVVVVLPQVQLEMVLLEAQVVVEVQLLD
jgi:hypothetical protein